MGKPGGAKVEGEATWAWWAPTLGPQEIPFFFQFLALILFFPFLEITKVPLSHRHFALRLQPNILRRGNFIRSEEIPCSD